MYSFYFSAAGYSVLTLNRRFLLCNNFGEFIETLVHPDLFYVLYMQSAKYCRNRDSQVVL